MIVQRHGRHSHGIGQAAHGDAVGTALVDQCQRGGDDFTARKIA
jgi:hypothetical protein